MLRYSLLLPLAAAAFCVEPVYEVAGVVPGGSASITLHAVASPFTKSTSAGRSGRFSFKNIPAGSYTLFVRSIARGEANKTVDIGPSSADERGRVALELEFSDSDFLFRDAAQERHAVSAKRLAIPGSSIREYEEAQRDLARPDVDSARRRLESAVAAAPQFSMAWNNLGTIAYQTRNYARAEECFRKALDAEPGSFQPLVNLGGVLINLGKYDEALRYNRVAVRARPNDALANAQLGQAHFALRDYDPAIKYLEKAREIDPAHFSHPQLFLGEIYKIRGEYEKAAEVLEQYLKAHPDLPNADRIRTGIAKLTATEARR